MSVRAQRRRLEYMPLSDLASAERNSKDHNPQEMRRSVARFGFIEVPTIDERTGRLVAGHGRRDDLIAAQAEGADLPDGIIIKNGEWHVPVVRGWRSRDDAEALAAGIALNRIGEGLWKRDELAEDLEQLASSELGLDGTGYSAADLEDLLAQLDREREPAPLPPAGPTLADRFLVPPFSVLDARQGYWQERKRHWLSLGIRSEVGRPANLLKMSETVLEAQRPKGQPNRSMPQDDSGNDPQFYLKKQEAERRLGHALTTAEFIAEHYDGPQSYAEGTSIFDPVLCEIAYRWFSPPKGLVLDPFAGGSVRGIVAARLDRRYLGLELRPEQVEANEEQAKAIIPRAAARPKWRVGDAGEQLRSGKIPDCDFLFSCPPYWNLEVYGDDPADLCNAPSWDDFCARYAELIGAACARLRPDRFACFVVGNLRDEEGQLLDLGAATRQAFEGAGLAFYNDAILLTSVGSLALRAARNFRLRKLGRCHQQVLVFVKGDPERAVEACGEVLIEDPALLFGEPLQL